jgi:PAS domain S-box-containing protein
MDKDVDNKQLLEEIERLNNRIAELERSKADYKKVENKLKERETYQKTIFSAIQTGIIVIDTETKKIIDLNEVAAKHIGAASSEIIGHTCHKYICPADEGKCPIIDLNQRVNHSERILLDINGNEILIIKNVVPITLNGRECLLESFIDNKERKNVEKELKLASLYNRSLIEASLDPLVTIGPDGKVTDVNNATETVTGYAREDIIGSDFSDYFTEPKKAKEGYLEVFSEGFVKDYPLEIQHKEGHITPVLYNASVYLDEYGEVVGVFAAARDITIHLKAEEDIKQSEVKFKSLIYNSSDLIRILDKNGIIIFDSHSSSRILGYPEGYFIGKNPLNFIHPDDLERVKKDLDEVYNNINPGTPTEFRIQRIDGTYLSVESVSKNMFHIPGIEGIVITTHPIQQRKEMENALRESEEKYRTLFDEDPDYTMLLGRDGVILDVNNAIINFVGLPKNELIGKNFSDIQLINPEDIEFYLNKFSSLIDGEIIEPFESKFIDKNGDLHWILVHITTVMVNNNISYILGIASDITEQKRAENEIKSSLNEKNILLQEVHHRVKNNMQIISSLLNLQTQYVEDEEAVDVLKESQNRVRSMAIIHEKLYQSEDLTNINFVGYIQSLVSNLFYSYNIVNNRIKPNLQVENLSLNIETAVPCGLIISELVSNSLKYAFPNEMKGEIFISLKAKNECYELIISDNGIGLPETFNYDNIDSLGIRLVKNLTEQIDGELMMNTNHGTEFKIKFKELKYKSRI